ncbi:pantetheine-phosphate adenylyltransferase [Williamsoniiplasma luminosum]|uniref:Phosphopantetheine adenylyltransferase n=1 Tax=Williamsoniiplasma luminosum TaxID=214888 RepID=A0A2S0NL33_9MOLU|nr:pantetheine-phosphate adenylyltransferase [Williamsoniiplasma luminosum]AVP49712.1 MAG: pantetheine-phosphate adenylyltransferase [Williamsoniiplasma luminosum]
MLEKQKIMFAGSFDPMHQGHLALIHRALKFFDQVVIVVTNNPEKTGQTDVNIRVQQIQTLIQDNPNIEIMINQNQLTIDFAQMHNLKFLLRGVRNIEDFSFEVEMAQANKILNPNIETIILISDADDAKISSRFIQQIDKIRKK